MKLRVANWGNSLAIRLPKECTRAAGLKAGDSVEASINPSGEIMLAFDKAFDKAKFLIRLAKLQSSLPMTDAVVDQMRQKAPY